MCIYIWFFFHFKMGCVDLPVLCITKVVLCSLVAFFFFVVVVFLIKSDKRLPVAPNSLSTEM